MKTTSVILPLLTLLLTLHVARVSLADDGVTKDELLIGVTTNLNGANNARSKSIMAGAKVVFDEANKKGGVNGRKIRVIEYDDSYDPKRAAENAKKLINEDKVFIIYGPYGTAPMKAILPAAEASKVPVIGPSTGAQFIRAPANRLIIPIRSGYFAEAEAMVKYSTETEKQTDIVTLYQDDAFGLEGRNGMQKAMDSRGLKFKAIAYKKDLSDLDTAVREVGAHKVVCLWGNAEPGVAIMEQLTKLKVKPIVFANAAMTTPAFTKVAHEYHLPVYLTQGIPLPTDTSLELVRSFQRDMKAAGVTPDWGAINGYLEGVVLVEALKRAGKDLTRDGLLKTFEAMSDVDFGGIVMSFGLTGTRGLREVFMTVVKGSDVVLVDQKTRKSN